MANPVCVVFGCSLILNVLQGLNKWYDHLRAIITRSTLFSSFNKVWDGLVLEELTLSLDKPTPPPQAFYSNDTHAPPALSRPAGNGSQGQGQGHDRGRYHKNGGGSSSGHNASDRGSKPTLSCLLGSPSTILGSRLSTCTPVHLLGGGQQQHPLPQQQTLVAMPGPAMVGPPFTPPLALIPALPPMYAAQQ
jgi:hypothetical protein